MRMNRWVGFLTSIVVLFSILNPASVMAKEGRTLEDESIYDLLVDRFDNGNFTNDENIDTQDMSAFSGGDFAGIINRIDYISEMGFTMISLGSIFATETYDGSHVLNYETLEPHFGSNDELAELIEVAHGKKMSIMADFPFSGVSANHIWAKDGLFTSTPADKGTIDWDSSDKLVKEALKNAVIAFVEEHHLDGIRLTKLDGFDTAYINEVIEAIKEIQPDIYVISNEAVEANFDAVPNNDKGEALKETFVSFDSDSKSLILFEDQAKMEFIQLDELSGPRFTFDMVEKRMFPPTRWKLATTALFTLPGIPVVTYGTEIAVNGESAPQSHPLVNFKTDMELYDFIGDLNKLRNQSEALRNGDYEILHNEDGFIVYKVANEDETWIVALNNSTTTSNFEFPKELVGEKKKLRGVLDGDLVKEADDGVFRVVLNREIAEIYIVEEDKGFNTPYLIASILIYVLFLSFLFIVWRRGKKSGQQSVEK
ncbi:alpha-amylase family glycosyl hydrolase [Sporosarcina sp. G11-34]|uniref:alpha-amylase family glycosyl hydrolase n=1 Tax=Sporosarcina sp. G11-34 TaxID=2849605 RepID=UPI0022A94D26|nr:alpha-amylase family glycosyl hydrolase [Sporosarcina sp. G11-34]MCZ2259010.1 alpha-amylase [Sporosarcina sp. G11-34]